MNFTAEYMGIDIECLLFRTIKCSFLEPMIGLSVFNRRRRRLFCLIKNIRLKLASLFNEFEDYFAVDSIPLKVCKTARASRSKICKQEEFYFPDKGFCASQNFYYYGYKFHGVCSISGVFQSLDIKPGFCT